MSPASTARRGSGAPASRPTAACSGGRSPRRAFCSPWATGRCATSSRSSRPRSSCRRRQRVASGCLIEQRVRWRELPGRPGGECRAAAGLLSRADAARLQTVTRRSCSSGAERRALCARGLPAADCRSVPATYRRRLPLCARDLPAAGGRLRKVLACDAVSERDWGRTESTSLGRRLCAHRCAVMMVCFH